VTSSDPRAGRPARRTSRRTGRRSGWAAAAVGVLAAAALRATAAPPARDDLGGTYRVRGTARIDAAPPVGRTMDARGDAVVRAGPAGEVRVRLASMGHSCELTGSRSSDGALAFAAGQRCTFELADPEARGRVEARLRTGRGRLAGRHLALDLAFQLSGAVSFRTSQAVQVLGVEVPSSWTPSLPVDGGASVQAEGDRDESRAVQPG
jgi:hypothetical protein